jgi:hypothetical protein
MVMIGVCTIAAAAELGPTGSSDEMPVFESVCTADCGEFADVSCEGATCSAVNRDCSTNTRGYVECNGVYTYCPVCPQCVDGEFKIDRTGICCEEIGGEYKDLYKCINEQWVYQSTHCGPSAKCPLVPLP